jgi:hypothetical protein
MQAWSRAAMSGDRSYFINALMTYMLDEEEEIVTLYSLTIYVLL